MAQVTAELETFQLLGRKKLARGCGTVLEDVMSIRDIPLALANGLPSNNEPAAPPTHGGLLYATGRSCFESVEAENLILLGRV